MELPTKSKKGKKSKAGTSQLTSNPWFIGFMIVVVAVILSLVFYWALIFGSILYLITAIAFPCLAICIIFIVIVIILSVAYWFFGPNKKKPKVKR